MKILSLSYIYAKLVRKYLLGKAVLNSSIHKTAVVGSGASIVNSSMGRYSYCGYDCTFVNTEIDAFCSIADNVVIGAAQHPMTWVSTSPVFEATVHSGPRKRFSHHAVPKGDKTIIGADVWIGNGAKIKSGVKIGVGAVVGTGAVVTKDVAPYSVVGGCPARHIRYRFDADTCERLLASEWWKYSDARLSEVAEYVQNPAEFLRLVALGGKSRVGGVIPLRNSVCEVSAERRAA